MDEVDSKGNKTADQVLQRGSLFVFNPKLVKSASPAQKGTGSYYWSQVNLASSGKIWLSVWNINDLLTGKR